LLVIIGPFALLSSTLVVTISFILSTPVVAPSSTAVCFLLTVAVISVSVATAAVSLWTAASIAALNKTMKLAENFVTKKAKMGSRNVVY